MIDLRFIIEALLSVSTWKVIKKFFGTLITRETLRCGEFCQCHFRQTTWGAALKLAIHLHSFISVIAADVDCEVSVSEAATKEESRQHHCMVLQW